MTHNQASAASAGDDLNQTARLAVGRAIAELGDIHDQAIASVLRTEESDSVKAITELFLSRTGGVIDGDLRLRTRPGHRSSRIVLESWTRSNFDNERSGDVVELRWRDAAAKAFIGWWDYTDSKNPKMTAWIGAHDEANNPGSPPHRHWSIEVADKSGDMQTRLAVPYGEDHTNIKTSSADFTIGYGTLRVASGALDFTVSTEPGPLDRRWSLRHGDNDDLRLSRFVEGEGATALRVSRKSGFLAVGGNFSAERQLHVRHSSAAALFEGTGQANSSLVSLRHTSPSQGVLDARVSGEQSARFLLESSGAMEWGDGRSRPLSLRADLGTGASTRQFAFNGADIAVTDRHRGLVLIDRETGAPHRLFLDNGQIDMEPL